MSSRPRNRLRGHFRASRKHPKKAVLISRASLVESLETRLYLTAAAYTWQNVNIGAGGFVDGIFYDPNNANVIYARTDIGGLYKSVNDGTNWTQLLDFVSNGSSANNYNGFSTVYQDIGVLSFAIDPENSNYLYADVGMYSGTNGMILYSRNGGQTWSNYNLPFYVGGNSNGRGDGEQIQVDPDDSNIVFLGSNSDGLWYSTNATSANPTFTQFSSSNFSPTSTTFVLFDPSGTKGSPSQTIFVGIDSTSSGTNLYETTNGGTSWAQVTGTGSLPTGYLPGHGVISNGYLYLGYANGLAPNTTLINGGVYRYNLSSGVWANISPKATGGNFGYDAVAADPENPNTVVVSSFDYYSGPDQIWRTVNANATTPTWTELYSYSGAQNSGYNGYDPTRNTTNDPWTAGNGDGIGNWAATIAINPNNSNQLMYGTGEGIWATNNASNNGANTQLTAANSWYFPDTGIEFTAVGGLAAATAGTPLYSAMGDIGGFAHTTLTYSPAAGNVGGSGDGTDYAGTNPNDAAIVGSIGTNDGSYTTNGSTFTGFAANPGGSTKYTGGTVAESANGSTIVWAPSGQTAYYSTNNGASWTESTLGASGALPTGGTIVSDKVNSNYFYYWTENSSDNVWTLYISSDGGHTFNASAGGTIRTGNVTLVANQYVAGQLWMGGWNGIYESTNFGASFTQIVGSSVVVYANDMAIGAPPPGSTTPTIYIYGTVPGSSFVGVWRNDNGGVGSWLQLNTTTQQWGGLIQTVAADPNVFGRVYLGINGRGIEMGNPANSLPANWTDTDINLPGNPGWATSSTTLSTGTIVNEWDVVGGGAGLATSSVSISSLTVSNDVATAISTAADGFQVGEMVTISGASNSVYDGTFVVTGLANTTAGISSGIGSATEFKFNLVTANGTASGTITAKADEQFNFAYEPLTGNGYVSAELMSMTNADNGSGTPQAGVMIRASTNADDPFFELVQTSTGSLVMEYRTTTGGSVTTQTLASAAVGSEYVEVARNGSNFSAYYSATGTSWTLGSTVAIAAMPSTANVGLAATAGYNSQLTDARFTNLVVSTGPSVQTAAAANPNPVTGTSTVLSALGSENGSNSGLFYTWSYMGPTGVSYTGATNGSSAAQSITANFLQAGSYNFTVTISDSSGLSVTSPVTVVVQQTPTNVVVSPNSSPVVPVGLTQQFSATAMDQFGNAIGSPTFNWAITGGGNSIDGTGNVTLGSTPGSFTVTASDGSAQGMATIIAENFAVPAGSTLDINLSATGPVTLSASGNNITAIQNGVQITLSGFSGVTVTDTGSGDVLDFSGPLALPFTFVNCGSSTVNVSSGTLSFAADMGGTINLGSLTVSNGAAAAMTAATTDSPTTLSLATLSIGTTGVLDVANNEVLINYGSGSDPIGTIAGQIASGYAGGAWNGSGIISSVAQTNPSYALGYADSADANNPAGLQSGQIEILYTLLGDANLDGKVNGEDFVLLSGSFNMMVTAGWDQGDFDYSGAVNGTDFVLQSENFNQAAQIAVPAVVQAAVVSSVATPTTSTAAASDSNSVSSPVVSKHAAKPKPRHGHKG